MNQCAFSLGIYPMNQCAFSLAIIPPSYADFVRTFTLDKKLEMYVMKTTNNVLPTVVYSELYRKRFCEAMERYFTVVPDKWTGLEADVEF